MGFELVEKNRFRENLGEKDVSISKNFLCLGQALSEWVREAGEEYLEIYFDLENNLVGLKPTSSGITGFKIQRGKLKGGKLSLATKIVARISRGHYNAEFDDGMITFEVNEIASKDKPKDNIKKVLYR